MTFIHEKIVCREKKTVHMGTDVQWVDDSETVRCFCRSRDNPCFSPQYEPELLQSRCGLAFKYDLNAILTLP